MKTQSSETTKLISYLTDESQEYPAEVEAADRRLTMYISRFDGERFNTSVRYPQLTRKSVYDSRTVKTAICMEAFHDELLMEFLEAEGDLHWNSEPNRECHSTCSVSKITHDGDLRQDLLLKLPVLESVLDAKDELAFSCGGRLEYVIIGKQSACQTRVSGTGFTVRIVLALKAPAQGCGLEVQGTLLPLYAGKAVVIDGAQQVGEWNESREDLVLLYCDVFHPNLSKRERRCIKTLAR